MDKGPWSRVQGLTGSCQTSEAPCMGTFTKTKYIRACTKAWFHRNYQHPHSQFYTSSAQFHPELKAHRK